jgi:acetyl esterase/lipase
MLKVSTLDKIAALFYRNGYLGLEKYAFPCRHPDPSGIGQTYIETAEFDPLRDDGTCYYEKLKQAGVNVHLEETKGTVHGYDVVKKSPIVRASVQKRHEFIEAILQQFSQQ